MVCEESDWVSDISATGCIQHRRQHHLDQKALAAGLLTFAGILGIGPGRAGGGEELGGLRAVKHYLQRAAVQGSPTMLAAVTGEYVRGAKVIETEVHPFRRFFQDLQIGESLLTHSRTVTEADLVNFGCLSGDHFYMHFDDIAAKESQFGKRIAHGCWSSSPAASRSAESPSGRRE